MRSAAPRAGFADPSAGLFFYHPSASRPKRRCAITGSRPVTAIVVLAAALGAACATGGQEDLGEEQRGLSGTRVNFSGSVQGMPASFDLRYVEELSPAVDTVDAPLDPVWAALPDAYVEMGIPLQSVNPDAHILGNDGFRARGELGGRRISRYLDCGRTMTGDVADEFDVQMTVLTQVQALEGTDRTRVVSLVDATAQPSATSGNAVRCASTRVLEDALLKALGLSMARSEMGGGG